MTGRENKSSRRAFFLQGSAALGAGVASTVGAAALTTDAATPDAAQSQQLALLQDREAIRQLQLAFTTLMENQAYEAAAELFGDQADLQLSGVRAKGMPAIRQLLADQYRHQTAPALHSAYRPNSLQAQDELTLSDDRLRASATFHVDVALGTALAGDSTIAQMARLQGQMADRHWESGRIEARYVKTHGRWKVASLRYLAS